MKRLFCSCGQVVFFDNHTCGNCGRELGFDPDKLTMLAAGPDEDPLAFCANRSSASRCNWLAVGGAGQCLSCRTSKVIPAVSKPTNRKRWRKLEHAKRRLLYELLYLGLPVDDSRLQFVFKEDQHSNPNVIESHVAIGHFDGVITINVAEADEVYREQMRQKMNEPYRTLLGHFRHESGHYFFNVIVTEKWRDEARALFGDESADYAAALNAYYNNGPRHGWQNDYISSYASSHPAEDWAECWAHYLHIQAILEVAEATGLGTGKSLPDWQHRFVDLAMALNEVMRSMGLADVYPFVITAPIADKIDFVHRAVTAFTGRPVVPLTAAG
jgi:hypothetical protein